MFLVSGPKGRSARASHPWPSKEGDPLSHSLPMVLVAVGALLTLAGVEAQAAMPDSVAGGRVTAGFMMMRVTPVPPFERSARDVENLVAWQSEVAASLASAAFGSRWNGPSGVTYRGEVRRCPWDGSMEGDPWALRAYGPLTGGQREDFYYLLADSVLPTMERVRWVLHKPPGRSPSEWTAIAHAIADSLSQRARTPARPSGTHPSKPSAGESSMTVQSAGDSIVAEISSAALRRDFADSSSWLATSEFAEDGGEFAGDFPRAELSTLLRDHWPAIATALLREPASIADSSAMLEALTRSAGGSYTQVEQDGVRWAVHTWVHLVLALGDDLKPCTACPLLESVFAKIGLQAFAGHYGGWYTNGALIAPLLQRAGSNRWTDLVFLRSLYGDFDLSVLDSCQGSFYDCQPFQRIIRAGERFLQEHPRSSIVRELRLLVARAHETAWSLSKTESEATDEGAFDPTNFTIEAPLHRQRAIELYEEHLRLNPADHRNPTIKRRLARIRLDIDTGCRAFVNWGIC